MNLSTLINLTDIQGKTHISRQTLVGTDTKYFLNFSSIYMLKGKYQKITM